MGGCGEENGGAGLCRLRCVSEQAGATKHPICVAFETSITGIYHTIATRRGRTYVVVSVLVRPPGLKNPAHDYVLTSLVIRTPLYRSGSRANDRIRPFAPHYLISNYRRLSTTVSQTRSDHMLS